MNASKWESKKLFKDKTKKCQYKNYFPNTLKTNYYTQWLEMLIRMLRL